ncbi:hypothetical protein GDO78_007530 [Eleutherodactylus coqui]|uniref:Secreted protein n=1 Tax=Eleutherodactylus coqui TaxID=57060 RepID=A0A8J6FGS3_ELECQ|nr:hypothetical protein GDO78_007530 [Eleutherodactylus coqui]
MWLIMFVVSLSHYVLISFSVMLGDALSHQQGCLVCSHSNFHIDLVNAFGDGDISPIQMFDRSPECFRTARVQNLYDSFRSLELLLVVL